VRHEFAPGLPRLRADKLRVQQVLLNLLSNASKFSDNKEVVIRAFTKDGCICISVEDQGVGISKADLTMLFQPFVQVGNKDIEHRSHGTGLGLHVSRELVRLHGGDLYLESEPYRGTIAFVQFPSGRTI
jgi:signal transduction histidine kinase